MQKVSNRVDRLSQHAMNAREEARRTADENSRRTLIQIAESYEHLAEDMLPPWVEKGSESAGTLVSWLGQRETKTAKPAPDLKAFGLELGGGRIFVVQERPVVQCVYRDKGKGKLTLYWAPAPTQDAQPAFSFGPAARPLGPLLAAG